MTGRGRTYGLSPTRNTKLLWYARLGFGLITLVARSRIDRWLGAALFPPKMNPALVDGKCFQAGEDVTNRGNRAVKVVPSCSDDATEIVPPWAVTISCVIKSPKPRLVAVG